MLLELPITTNKLPNTYCVKINLQIITKKKKKYIFLNVIRNVKYLDVQNYLKINIGSCSRFYRLIK
jgi:hypothetical protein